MKNKLKLKKVHWLVSVEYPFVTVFDVDDIIKSLAENEDVPVDDWSSEELASFVKDVLGDL